MSSTSPSFPQSPYTGPHMDTTNPFTRQPWTAAEQKTVDRINSLASDFASAVKTGNSDKAQIILEQRDNILSQADGPVQTAFALVALNYMTQQYSDLTGTD